MSLRVITVCIMLNFMGLAHGQPNHSVTVLYGQATVFGDINPDRPRAAVWLTRYLVQTDEPQSWGLGIHVFSSAVDAGASDFPYTANEQVKFLGFLFVPTYCWHNAGSVCLGIGQGTVNANANSARRDYGTWNYHAHGGFPLNHRFRLEGQVSFVGKVEMEQAARASEFSLTLGLVGIGATL